MKYFNKENKLQKLAAACAFAGIMIFSACDGPRDHISETETENDVEQTGIASTVTTEETDFDRTANANMEEGAVERNYDTSTMGTAATNRKPMESSGQNLSDSDYQQLRQEYDDVNKEIRESLRQNPGVDMRFTDDTRTSDYNYGYYGVYYDDVTDPTVRKQFQDLEKRRAEVQNKMRGKMDTKSKAYTTAELDAVPAKGYDELYSFIDDQINYPTTAENAGIEGTIFVEFIIGPNGNITNPTVIETIDGQRQPIRTAKNPLQITEMERKKAIEEMEQEALKAIKATNGMWEPAMQENQKVAQQVQLPVRFRMFDVAP